MKEWMNELMAPQRNKAKKCQLSALVSNQYIQLYQQTHTLTAKRTIPRRKTKKKKKGNLDRRKKESPRTAYFSFLHFSTSALPGVMLSDENLINVNPFVT